ncbi:hypothetical protein MTX78_05855 [Hymenobacter tibetensis]|uniref:HTH cro/C1-type domain-containing protein n=1 Tax=Hymenobacter tibetensis TaxID=497967 RepID=A0ABY4D7Z5_9BACT|nr:hypothetical protein [Hymenobacter tibetensis]UOG76118.1 hypothetical protein MTX78_05855 [Hymenobacter tibetensis]
MQQHPINQRISFLLQSFQLSARAFSESIGEKPTITQNYVGTRNSMPGADYLEKVLKHFESINPVWFLTGEGEPFISGSSNPQTLEAITGRKPSVSTTGGKGTHSNYSISDCEKERDIYKAERDSLTKEVGLLRDQLAMKDQLIAVKDEMLTLLRK